MTTTGSGHGRGMYSLGGGRGGHSVGWNRPQQKTKSKKTLQDYTYYIGSAKQASDYSMVTKYLINHIHKTYTNGDNIANTLKATTAVDLDMWRLMLSQSIKDPTMQKPNMKQRQRNSRSCTRQKSTHGFDKRTHIDPM